MQDKIIYSEQQAEKIFKSYGWRTDFQNISTIDKIDLLVQYGAEYLRVISGVKYELGQFEFFYYDNKNNGKSTRCILKHRENNDYFISNTDCQFKVLAYRVIDYVPMIVLDNDGNYYFGGVTPNQSAFNHREEQLKNINNILNNNLFNNKKTCGD